MKDLLEELQKAKECMKNAKAVNPVWWMHRETFEKARSDGYAYVENRKCYCLGLQVYVDEYIPIEAKPNIKKRFKIDYKKYYDYWNIKEKK